VCGWEGSLEQALGAEALSCPRCLTDESGLDVRWVSEVEGNQTNGLRGGERMDEHEEHFEVVLRFAGETPPRRVAEILDGLPGDVVATDLSAMDPDDAADVRAAMTRKE
jgi:hypothetical protein